MTTYAIQHVASKALTTIRNVITSFWPERESTPPQTHVSAIRRRRRGTRRNTTN
jgi:hypothetical protein